MTCEKPVTVLVQRQEERVHWRGIGNTTKDKRASSNSIPSNNSKAPSTLTPHKASVGNNNNNTIWKGSVFTGEEHPHHSGELKHALPQAGGPTQSQLSRPMSSGHHISMEHRLRRKQLNSDTNACNKTCFERNTRKKKRRNFFLVEKSKRTRKIKRSKKKRFF